MADKWVLKKSAAKRFETGHPWVFSNEIEQIKGPEPGALLDLVNSSGRFLARGFANPSSLIAFRILSRTKEDIDLDWIQKRILLRRSLREHMSLGASRRIVHGESDGIPGFIIDEFLSVDSKRYWSVHIHSAGMERMLRHVSAKEFFERFRKDLSLEGIVIRRDSKSRELEGLKTLEVDLAGQVPDPLWIKVDLGKELPFKVSLVSGQKGGFFLDQRRNVWWLRDFLKHVKFDGPCRVFDAFSYCGQWGVGVGELYQSAGKNVGVSFADSSKVALEAAKENALKQQLKVSCYELDLVEKDWPVADKSCQVVIADPPALIKTKKHYFAGRRAYLKVVLKALKATEEGGVAVLSSCSFHLAREDFREILMEATQILGISIRILHDFSSPPDHMRSPDFPEGDYLKGFVCLRT